MYKYYERTNWEKSRVIQFVNQAKGENIFMPNIEMTQSQSSGKKFIFEKLSEIIFD